MFFLWFWHVKIKIRNISLDVWQKSRWTSGMPFDDAKVLIRTTKSPEPFGVYFWLVLSMRWIDRFCLDVCPILPSLPDLLNTDHSWNHMDDAKWVKVLALAWCGRGIKLDLRVRPAPAPVPAASGDLEIWEPGNMEFWKSGTWKSGKLGSKNPKEESSQNQNPCHPNVGKVWISRKKSSWPFSDHFRSFFHGPNKEKTKNVKTFFAIQLLWGLCCYPPLVGMYGWMFCCMSNELCFD